MKNGKVLVADAMDSIKLKVNNGVNLGNKKEIRDITVSAESIGDSGLREQALAQKQNLESAVNGVIVNLGIESLTAAQKDAAVKIASLAVSAGSSSGNMLEYLGKLKTSNDGVMVSAEAMGVSDAIGAGDVLKVSAESFDGQSLTNALTFSITFNLLAARQDEFGEAFYPTITIDPTLAAFNVESEYTSVFKEYKSDLSGSLDSEKMGKIPLIKAMYDENILGADKNRVIPVLRPESEELLLKDYSYETTLSGEEVNTAPVKFGKKYSLKGISQTDALIAKGLMDNTDAIANAVTLDKVYYSIAGKDAGGNAVTEMFTFETSMLPRAVFVASPNGSWKDMILSFENNTILLKTSATKTAKGANSKVLGALPANHVISFSVSVNGTLNVETADTSIYGSNIEIHKIMDASGASLVKTSPDYIAIAEALANVKLEGYVLEAYRTNTNLRTRGTLVTNDIIKQQYVVPLRSGVTVLTPLNNPYGSDNDAGKLMSQIEATHLKTSIAAVGELQRQARLLKDYTASGISTGVEFLGMGRTFVSAYYSQTNVNVSEIVDSIKSHDRIKDLQAAITNKIREEIVTAYIDSGYNRAFATQYGITGAKPTILIGTDPKIKQYLTSEGNKIDLGDDFGEVKIVSSMNPKVAGKIYVTFIIDDETKNTSLNPLSFGNCIWSPTITTDVPKQNGGGVIREVHNVPRYTHITNLPILVELDVTNISGVIGKVAIKFANA